MSEENEGENENETRNPFLYLRDNGMMPLHNYEQELSTIEDRLVTIQVETRPVPGHPDPMAIKDSWDQVFDQLDQLRGEGD